MQAGLGQAKPRARGRGRQRHLRAPAGNGNGGTTAPVRGRGMARKEQAAAGKGPQIGVAAGAMPGPGGRQLAARVSSGAITQEQADRTMKQRQTLAKAFGSNWRDKLQVGGQSFAEVRQGLKASPGNPKLAAINKKLLANRKALLEKARTKNAGGDEEGQE